MKIKFKNSGKFEKTYKYFNKLNKAFDKSKFHKYGKMGVNALMEATPKNTGKTANSWEYDIIKKKDYVSLRWYNTNYNNGVSIAIILQYGHGTKNGGYVRGIDYINPAMKPIFEKMAKEMWEEVKA